MCWTRHPSPHVDLGFTSRGYLFGGCPAVWLGTDWPPSPPGAVSISDKMSYHKISPQSFEPARLGMRISHWNLAGCCWGDRQFSEWLENSKYRSHPSHIHVLMHYDKGLIRCWNAVHDDGYIHDMQNHTPLVFRIETEGSFSHVLNLL